MNSSLGVPRVSWYHDVGERDERTFVPLSNTEFWEQRNEDYYYCQYYYSIQRNFSEPSDFDCTAASGQTGNLTVYNCDQVLDTCYNGEYQCRVSATVGDGGEAVNVTNKKIYVICKHKRSRQQLASY